MSQSRVVLGAWMSHLGTCLASCMVRIVRCVANICCSHDGSCDRCRSRCQQRRKWQHRLTQQRCAACCTHTAGEHKLFARAVQSSTL